MAPVSRSQAKGTNLAVPGAGTLAVTAADAKVLAFFCTATRVSLEDQPKHAIDQALELFWPV